MTEQMTMALAPLDATRTVEVDRHDEEVEEDQARRNAAYERELQEVIQAVTDEATNSLTISNRLIRELASFEMALRKDWFDTRLIGQVNVITELLTEADATLLAYASAIHTSKDYLMYGEDPDDDVPVDPPSD